MQPETPASVVARINSPMSRRTALGGLGMGAMSLALAACSGGDSSTSSSAPQGDELAQIQAAGEIRIGMEGTFQPYGYHDSTGELVGFEKEIADLVAADLGVTPVYVETQWDSLIAGVDVGRYDIVINNIAPTDARREVFDFSIPYAISEGKVGVSGDSPLQSVDEIPGHSAAQTETSNFGQEMAKAGANLVPVTGFDEAIMLVSLDRVDMTGNDYVTFEAFFQQRPDVDIRLLDGTLGDAAESAILMAKGQDSLKAAIDESLRTHMDNGDLARIYQKYVSLDLTPES